MGCINEIRFGRFSTKTASVQPLSAVRKGWPDFGMRWALPYYYCCCSWIATATRAFNSGCPSGNVYSLPYAKALTKYRGTNIAGGNSFWKQPSSQCYHVTLAAVCSKSVRPYSSTTGWSPVSSAMWQQHNLIKVVSAQNNPVLFLINQE